MIRSLIAFAVLSIPVMLCCTVSGEEAGADSPPSNPFEGCWQRADDAGFMLKIERDRFVISTRGRLQAGRILRAETGGLLVRFEGIRMLLRLEIGEDGRLKADLMHPIKRGKLEWKTYAKIDPAPPELDLKPLELGKSGELAAERTEEIKSSLERRMKEDQAVRKDQKRMPDMAKTDRENTAWLRKIGAEVGWIDTARFGPAAASAAFLIVQHSGDLPFMLAALPEIGKDLRASKGDPQAYALLYDRVRIFLGEKQRYGSQVGMNEKGKHAVLPLEDGAKVDEFRKELGLQPLREYLDSVEKMTGREVEISSEE